jgi:hypothetical protein
MKRALRMATSSTGPNEAKPFGHERDPRVTFSGALGVIHPGARW